jgi:ADP-heptose:LPS heptosyltransferase
VRSAYQPFEPFTVMPSNYQSPSYGKQLREMTGPYRARNPLLVGGLYVADALCRALPKRERQRPSGNQLRLLVANWGHLGDVVTILPLLKLLEQHPRVRELGVLIGSWSQCVLKASDIKAQVHVIDHWALDRSAKSKTSKVASYLARRAPIVSELRECRYDMSIDTFVSFPSTHGIMWSASIPRRVGFTSGGLGPCLTDPVDWLPDNRTMLDHQLDLMRAPLGNDHPKTLRAAYPGFASTLPERLQGLKKPYIVIHMGVQDVKGWVPEKWVALATALRAQGFGLVATGGPGQEAEAARVLCQTIDAYNLAGQATWDEFIAIVAHAAGVVSVDSVTAHIAACFSVPTVVLTTGRTHLNLWRPNGDKANVIMYPVGCAPCFRTKGCEAMACVRHIEVEEVLRSLKSVLNTNSFNQTSYAH